MLGGVNIVHQPAASQEFIFETQSEEGKAIDRTSSPRKLYYTFELDVMSIKVDEVRFMIQHKLARSIFYIKFTVKGRSIYDDENITFDLDVLNPEN